MSFDPEVLKVWKLSFISSVRGSEADVNLKVNLDWRNSKWMRKRRRRTMSVFLTEKMTMLMSSGDFHSRFPGDKNWG